MDARCQRIKWDSDATLEDVHHLLMSRRACRITNLLTLLVSPDSAVLRRILTTCYCDKMIMSEHDALTCDIENSLSPTT